MQYVYKNIAIKTVFKTLCHKVTGDWCFDSQCICIGLKILQALCSAVSQTAAN